MLPPSTLPLASFDFNSTDEQGIIMYLDMLMKGCPLPDNVLGEINPYQYEPSKLPDGIWYFVGSNVRKETASGFWKATGEVCEIYKDSIISGWRTTLESVQGSAPLRQRTKWLMKEYRITMNDLSDKSDLEGSRILCRIFHGDGEDSRFEAQKANRNVASAEGNSSLAFSTFQSSGNPSRLDVQGEILGKDMEYPTAERLAGSVSDNLLELDRILSGDFLELDDLADHESLASSSDNSSCISRISDESFDSLLRDLEDEINKDVVQKGSNSKFTVAAYARPIEMVMKPAAVGSLATETGSKSPAENADVRAMGRNDIPTSSHHEASSSKSRKSNSKGDEESGSKKKPKKRYLCFIPF